MLEESGLGISDGMLRQVRGELSKAGKMRQVIEGKRWLWYSVRDTAQQQGG